MPQILLLTDYFSPLHKITCHFIKVYLPTYVINTRLTIWCISRVATAAAVLKYTSYLLIAYDRDFPPIHIVHNITNCSVSYDLSFIYVCFTIFNRQRSRQQYSIMKGNHQRSVLVILHISGSS